MCVFMQISQIWNNTYAVYYMHETIAANAKYAQNLGQTMWLGNLKKKAETQKKTFGCIRSLTLPRMFTMSP